MLCPAHSAPAEGGWRRGARPRSARWRSESPPSWSNHSGEAVQGLPAVPATRVIEVGRLLRIVSVRRVLSVTVLSAGAGICAYTYIADILGHAVGAARWVFVVLMVVYGVGAFAGSLGSGVVTDRVGPDRTTAASVGMLVVVLGLVPAVRTYVLMVVLVLVWGPAFVASTVPPQHKLVEVAADRLSVAVSLNSPAICLGQGLVPPWAPPPWDWASGHTATVRHGGTCRVGAGPAPDSGRDRTRGQPQQDRRSNAA